jgi:hypothetical protein
MVFFTVSVTDPVFSVASMSALPTSKLCLIDSPP